jgi:hypothetical protein
MNPEDTTTSEGQIEEQAPQAQPEIVDTNQAVTEEDDSYLASSEVDTQDSVEDDNNSSDDLSEEELLNWASKKGIKTDNTAAMLKMVRDAEKKMHETQSSIEARKLREAVVEADTYSGVSDIDIALNRLAVREFYLDNPEAKLYDDQMATIVKDKPYLANDLETLYLLAKAKNMNIEQDVIKKQARKEALTQAAKAEAAAPPNNSASTRETPKAITDEDIASMSLEQYRVWKESENFNPFVAP